MQLIISLLLFGLISHAAPIAPQSKQATNSLATTNVNQTYDYLNKAFNLDRSLKSKVVGIGVKSKIIDMSTTTGFEKQNKKIENGYEALKKEFNSDFEKKFSKDEIAYLNKLFSHDLIMRLIKFQNDFIVSDSRDGLITTALKK